VGKLRGGGGGGLVGGASSFSVIGMHAFVEVMTMCT